MFEAHLDHPAFVVETVESPTVVSTTFRGGVLTPYFTDAAVALRRADGSSAPGRVIDTTPGKEPDRPLRTATIELDQPTDVAPGDVLTWDLEASTIADGLLCAPVCDDLASLVAALCAVDELTTPGNATDPPTSNVRLLFTRGEEVGFVGAIAACKLETIPLGARIIALETSRSYADSPLGDGPIVRVGDRLSVFSPALTAAVVRIAHRLAGAPERLVGQPTDTKKKTESTPDAPAPMPGFRFQRKLMPGGACEATAFGAYGFEATCVCLPLRNYHNMGDLDAVEPDAKAGTYIGAAPVAPEIISIDDFHNLVALLIACGRHLGAVEPLKDRLDKLYDQRRYVLDA